MSVLSHHTDMIDSLIKINFPRTIENQQHSPSSYVQWLVSASRDRKLTLWKLYDGLPMKRSQFNLTKSQRKSGGATPHSSQLLSGRISAEDYLRNRSSLLNNQKNNTSQVAGAGGDSSGMQTPLLNNNAEEDDETPLINKNSKPKKNETKK